MGLGCTCHIGSFEWVTLKVKPNSFNTQLFWNPLTRVCFFSLTKM
jgi:hypothetical protein